MISSWGALRVERVMEGWGRMQLRRMERCAGDVCEMRARLAGVIVSVSSPYTAHNSGVLLSVHSFSVVVC